MALPPDFRVHSMSLIKDPADKIPSSRAETSSRAILLLANVDHSEPASYSIKYVLCQLQIVLPSGNQERVLTRMVARGSIPMELGNADVAEDEVVNGIFVAGGSFLFNLDMAVEDSGKTKVPLALLLVLIPTYLLLIRCNKIRILLSP